MKSLMTKRVYIILFFTALKLAAASSPKDDRVYKFTGECIKFLPLDNDSTSGRQRLQSFSYVSKDTHAIVQRKDTLIICEGNNLINGIDTVVYFILDTSSMKVDSAYIYITSLVQKISNSVYPGDVNHDGRVSYLDFLFWADRFGAKVTKRFEKSEAWKPYAMPLTEWKDTTAFYTKTFLADADGDGQVSLNDVLPIINNYGKSHVFGETITYDSITNFSYPIVPIKLVINNANISLGDMISLDLMVGSMGQPLQEISGIGYVINTYAIANGVAKKIPVKPEFLPYNSWLKYGGITDFTLFDEIDTGSYYGIQALTNRKKAEGGGGVGQVRIIVDDLIIQNLKAGNPIVFELAEARLVGSDKNIFLRTQLFSDTLKANALSALQQAEPGSFSVRVENSKLIVENQSVESKEPWSYEIKDMLGATVKSIWSEDQYIEIDLDKQLVGCYMLQIVHLNKIVYARKIVSN